MRRLVTVSLVVLVSLAAPVGGIPGGRATLPPDDGLLAPPPPSVTAGAWILYDDTFGHVLAENEADLQLAVASTTKIMTALVVLEGSGPDETVEITTRADQAGESEIGLVPGEPAWTVEDLLAALLLHSANDAAVALAEHVGGSVAGFADLMNAKAAELGLRNTHFVNPHGLDHRDHYSSARDLLAMSLVAMDDPRFARLVQGRSANLPATPDGDPRVAVNRNELLAVYPGAIGVKTGYTSNAQLTMVAAAERDRRRIYTVVLGSADHFGDTVALLDYGFAEFAAMTLVPATSEVRRPLVGGVGKEVADGFELFIVTEPVAEVRVDGTATEETATSSEPVEPPDDLVREEEPPAALVVETDRRPELPGLLDAVTWPVRYWNWILAGLGE